MDIEIETSIEIKKHIYLVSKLIEYFIYEINLRAKQHDMTKFSDEEFDHFCSATKLKSIKYNSEEYKEELNKLKPALDHHYENNRHHPEHFKNGINDMNLIDLIEMFADWSAATKKHDDTHTVLNSIKINEQRFNMSEQLVKIFKNTFNDFENDIKRILAQDKF